MARKKLTDGRDQDRLAESIPDFAARADVSVRSIYASIARGDGPPTIKIGARRLVLRESGKAWLQGLESEQTAQYVDLAHLDIIDDIIFQLNEAGDLAPKVRDLIGELFEATEEARRDVRVVPPPVRRGQPR